MGGGRWHHQAEPRAVCPALTSLISGSHSQTPPRPSGHPHTLAIATHRHAHTHAHTSFGNNLDLHCPVLSPRHWIPSEHSSSPHLAAHLPGQHSHQRSEVPGEGEPALCSDPSFPWISRCLVLAKLGTGAALAVAPSRTHVRPGPGEGAIVEKDGKRWRSLGRLSEGGTEGAPVSLEGWACPKRS